MAREASVRALYLVENRGLTVIDALAESFEALEDDEIGEELWERGENSDSTRDLAERFAKQLTEGTFDHGQEIDELIDGALTNFNIDRLASIDRNILRLAIFELVEIPYIGPAVTVNEAVEIAKRYSTEESGKFVNGVLGRIIDGLDKRNWDSRTAPRDPDLPELEKILRAPKPVIAEEVVQAESEEGQLVKKYGVWRVRSAEEEADDSNSKSEEKVDDERTDS